MRNRKSAFFLVAPLLLFSTITFGQESHNGLNTTVAPNLGTYEDGSGFRFFHILSRAFHTQARPLTFAETIAASSVVARGYFVGVIPGRSITQCGSPRITAN